MAYPHDIHRHTLREISLSRLMLSQNCGALRNQSVYLHHQYDMLGG
jgi:hypothetical protein